MTTVCSSKLLSDHHTETKLITWVMVVPRQAFYMVTAVLLNLAYLVSYILPVPLSISCVQKNERKFLRVQSHSPVLSPFHRIETAFKQQCDCVQCRRLDMQEPRSQALGNYREPGSEARGIVCEQTIAKP